MFGLKTGNMPFGKAIPDKDRLYKFIANGKSEEFWKAHG